MEEKKNPKIKQSAEYNMNFLPDSKEKLASSFDNMIKSVKHFVFGIYFLHFCLLPFLNDSFDFTCLPCNSTKFDHDVRKMKWNHFIYMKEHHKYDQQ